MRNFKPDSMDRLYEVILSLKDKEECQKFFTDLCTVREIYDMAQRLETAVMLDRKESYLTIVKDVEISTATIGRVSKCLKYGSGGYRLALDRLKEKENDQ